MSAASAALLTELQGIRTEIDVRREADRKAEEKVRRARREYEGTSRALGWALDQEEKLIAALRALDVAIPPKEKP